MVTVHYDAGVTRQLTGSGLELGGRQGAVDESRSPLLFGAYVDQQMLLTGLAQCVELLHGQLVHRRLVGIVEDQSATSRTFAATSSDEEEPLVTGLDDEELESGTGGVEADDDAQYDALVVGESSSSSTGSNGVERREPVDCQVAADHVVIVTYDAVTMFHEVADMVRRNVCVLDPFVAKMRQ